MSMTLQTEIPTPQIRKLSRPKSRLQTSDDFDTEKSIIKTLAYYEALGQYPLTALELYRYLQKENNEQNLPSFYGFYTLLLNNQTLSKNIASKNGFYFLKGNEKFYHERIFRQKIAIAKWKKVKKITFYLAACPYLRGIIVSGSLAFSNTKRGSDIDFLITTAQRRIWTCRTFLSFFLQIIGQRRHGNVIQNKICLNHYIAQNCLLVSLQNLSNAHLYSHLVPLTNYRNFQLFLEQNSWMAKLLFFYPQRKQNHLRQVDERSFLFRTARILGRGLEFLLSKFLGDFLEKRLALWQIKRIRQKTNWRKLHEDQLYLSQGALLFHYPICKNAEVMDKYLKKIQALKLACPVI